MTKNQEGREPKDLERDGLADQDDLGNGGDSFSEHGEQPQVVTREDFEMLLSEVRGLQGKMDKDANHIRKQIQDDLFEQLGVELTPEQQRKKDYIELRQRVDELAGVSKEQTPAKGDVSEADEAYAEVFKALEIDKPTSEDYKIAMKHKDNPIAMTKELLSRRFNKPIPTPASAVTPGTVGKGNSLPSSGELYSQFDALKGRPLDERLPSGKTVLQARNELVAQMEEAEEQE